MKAEQQSQEVLNIEDSIATPVAGRREFLPLTPQSQEIDNIESVSGIEENKAENLDSFLLVRIRQGDELALSLLYDRHSTVVYSVALRVLRNSACAQDVLQEVFMQIWRNPPQFEVTEWGLSGWMAVVSRNRSISILRHEASHLCVPIEDYNFVSPQDLGHQAERHQLHQKAQEIIVTLPEEHQQLLSMSFFDGISHSEIAALTGLPLGTVKTRIRCALSTLRRGLIARTC
jgi:RNA polymerase sigma-70 factor (ECF subfamily)